MLELVGRFVGTFLVLFSVQWTSISLLPQVIVFMNLARARASQSFERAFSQTFKGFGAKPSFKACMSCRDLDDDHADFLELSRRV